MRGVSWRFRVRTLSGGARSSGCSSGASSGCSSGVRDCGVCRGDRPRRGCSAWSRGQGGPATRGPAVRAAMAAGPAPLHHAADAALRAGSPWTRPVKERRGRRGRRPWTSGAREPRRRSGDPAPRHPTAARPAVSTPPRGTSKRPSRLRHWRAAARCSGPTAPAPPRRGHPARPPRYQAAGPSRTRLSRVTPDDPPPRGSCPPTPLNGEAARPTTGPGPVTGPGRPGAARPTTGPRLSGAAGGLRRGQDVRRASTR